MKEFFLLLNETYYSEAILFIIQIIAAIAGIRLSKNHHEAIPFIIYIILDILLLIAGWFIAVVLHYPAWAINYFELSNFGISIVEVLVYYQFFIRLFNNSTIQYYLLQIRKIYLLLVIVCLVGWLLKNDYLLNYITKLTEVIGLIFLLAPTLFYYRYLLNNTATYSVFDRPSFWIVTGIFFYALASIPLLLIARYITRETEMGRIIVTALYYTPYIVHFILLTKAFLCRKPLMI